MEIQAKMSPSDGFGKTHPDKPTDKPTDNRSNEQPIIQSSKQSDEQSNNHSNDQLSINREIYIQLSKKNECGNLSNRMLSVLSCYYYNTYKVNGRLFININVIAQTTGLSISSVKDAVHCLRRYGYFLFTKRLYYHSYRGSTYLLNMAKCEAVLANYNTQSHNQPHNRSKEQSNSRSIELSNNSTVVSSSFSRILTTNCDSAAVYNDPQYQHEITFWKGLGLKEAKFTAWSRTLNISPIDLAESCCHCWYDVVINEKSLKKDPMNYLYGSSRTNSYYTKPKGYVSALDQAINRQIERNKKLERLEELKKEEIYLKQKADEDSLIDAIVSDKNHPIYIDAMEQLIRETRHIGGVTEGPAFLPTMRGKIRHIINSEGSFIEKSEINNQCGKKGWHQDVLRKENNDDIDNPIIDVDNN